MTDALDEMFSSDLEKLGKGVPSELAMNAAKVRAAQDPKDKGAEKPDLYAKGKGRGKGGKAAEDEKNDERKSKGPNKGEKKAALDKQFDADMRQIVGADAPESAPDFERPDVKIAGQVADAIDDHYLKWMRERADEDVVKEASAKDVVRAAQQVGEGEAVKGLKRKLLAAAGKGAAGSALVVGPAAYVAGRKDGKRKSEKTAGVITNPENEDLIARIRRAAAGEHRHGGCSDV